MFRNERTDNPWPTLAFIGVLVVTLLFPGAIRSSAHGLFQAGDPQPGVPGVAVTAADSVPPPALQLRAAVGPYSVRLPLISLNYPLPPLSRRLGYGLVVDSFSQYPEAASLRAGWYVNWNVQQTPQRPNGMEFVQMVRLHQNLTPVPHNPPFLCDSSDAWDRSKCPYATPASYTFRPSADVITQAADANPGSLWLIGNEMDRRDWPGGGQDEMLPELYATAYRDLYTLIKGADPTARLAIGGVIQATPFRLDYLTEVWNAYQQQFGTSMPVDVWNVHNFILQEKLCCHGASIPPGNTAQTGTVYADADHVNMTIFAQQIRDFRAWMKAKGQQDKPLIVSEYGVLYSHVAAFNTAPAVQDFMIQTFDYFLNTKDCNLGYAADQCRLVQRWNWYSFNDSSFNTFGKLFDPLTFQITSTGARFREYSLKNLDALGQ